MSNPNDFWEDEGDREYMTEEEAEAAANGQYNPEVQEYQEVYEDDPESFMDVYEDEYENMDDQQLDAKNNEIMDTALIRLEQGKLYKLIMETIDNGMFAETGCDERSITNVEREMKAFIMSRLEVLLGIRKKQPKKVKVVREQSAPQLDEVELAVIKKITSNAMEKAGVKPTGIKKIGAPARPQPQAQPKKQVAQPPTQKQAPKVPPKPQQAKKQGPAKKKAQAKPLGKRPLTKKSPYQMTEEELIARNAQIKHRSSARSMENDPNPPLPPATADQMEMYYQNQSVQSGDHNTDALTKHILNAIRNK